MTLLPEIGALCLYIVVACCMSISFLHNYISISSTRLVWAFVALSIFISYGILIYSFIISDFSLYNVYLNSHTTKPLIYKISAAWGSHEGSMMLWIWVLAFLGFLFTQLQSTNDEFFIKKVSAIQAFITLFFVIYTLSSSNPFARLHPMPENGLGFNPILQDIGLAMHPPMLYVGYVGLSMVFSISAAVLWHNNIKTTWSTTMLPWAMLVWSALTAGIVLGSWWAYRELGWGGYWFWDPVENISLMPWLLTTALIHSLIAAKRFEIFKYWALLLAGLSFGFTIAGTLIVRSGLITSVHSFAQDPERGRMILYFLSIITVLFIVLFAYRLKTTNNQENNLQTISHTGTIYAQLININNLLFVLSTLIVAFATIYPIFLEFYTGNTLVIGPQYYNQIMQFIVAVALLTITFIPMISKVQNCNNFSQILLKYLKFNKYAILTSLLIILAIVNFYKPSFMQALVVFLTLVLFLQSRFRSLMDCVHASFALAIFAIALNAAATQETQLIMKQGDTAKIYNTAYSAQMNGIFLDKQPDYISRITQFTLYKNHDELGVAFPEVRLYPIEEMQTTEAAIFSQWFWHIYITTGDIDEAGATVVRLIWQPFIPVLWFAGFALSAFGALSFFNRMRQKD